MTGIELAQVQPMSSKQTTAPEVAMKEEFDPFGTRKLSQFWPQDAICEFPAATCPACLASITESLGHGPLVQPPLAI